MAAPFEFKSDQKVENTEQKTTQYGVIYGGTIGQVQTPVTALDIAYLTNSKTDSPFSTFPPWAWVALPLILLAGFGLWLWKRG